MHLVELCQKIFTNEGCGTVYIGTSTVNHGCIRAMLLRLLLRTELAHRLIEAKNDCRADHTAMADHRKFAIERHA